MIILENENFCLKLSDDCCAESLVLKATNEECLEIHEKTPFFSLTEDRPYNNEIKLAHPNKRTTFNANRVRKEGNKLIVGFELVTFEAVIEVKTAPEYITFKLTDFIIKPTDFAGLIMTPPPVSEFRLVQLPVANRKNFGEWLNVMHDDSVAIAVIATSPYERIDSEKRNCFRIMTADAVRETRLKNCEAALIVSPTDKFLDAVETIENDYNLPKGVKSRRSEHINDSIYWIQHISPENVDEHIALAIKGGFKKMLIYYTAIFKNTLEGYAHCGDYDLKDIYTHGYSDLEKMLKKIKDAGIAPGIHHLHSHIGKYSRYVTPVADHRLNRTRAFTLAKPLSADDSTIYVEQNPEGCTMHPYAQILQFDGELIYYESYTTEPPYCFKGCVRGHWSTKITPHSRGTRGGLLDVSEYGATSVYIDQNTSLQDEVADKLAKAYNCGFEFVYFDGSEGTNPPFEFHVPNAQYRVYKKLKKAPLFCEGAAKAHFSWHMLSGGNAFDSFGTDIFKEKIAEFPVEEAPRMANDFTRINFGWWAYRPDMQPDHFEYATSRGAAWDCPGTLIAFNDVVHNNPRTDDNFEVLRRWEDVRARKWLSPVQKEMLKDPNQEHILIINENGDYELLPYYEIKTSDNRVAAFHFERLGKTWVVCWHKTGQGQLSLSLGSTSISYFDKIGGQTVGFEDNGDSIAIPLGNRRYLVTDLDKDIVIKAFENAKIFE